MQQSGVATYRLGDWTSVHLATGKPGIFAIEHETAGNQNSRKVCMPHISSYRCIYYMGHWPPFTQKTEWRALTPSLIPRPCSL